MSEAKLPKPVDHSMAHHLVTYAANNMIAPLVHAQIARDEYEELERQYQETVSDLSISATLVRNRTQEAETLRAENERLRGALELIAGKGWSSLCVEHAAEEMHTMAVKALAVPK